MFRSLVLTFSLLLATASTLFAEDWPADLVQFNATSGQTVFEAAPGQWDSLIRERGWILRDDDHWKLWYTGYNQDSQPATMKLGLATSTDGIHWERHAANPLVDDFWVEDMIVVRHDNLFFMFAEGRNDQAQLLKSVDGVQWERVGTLDIRLSNGQPIPPGPFGTPTAFYEDGVWNLFYERRDEGVWLARSADMKVWTNVQDEPVLVPGPEAYDRLMIAMNQVIRHGDRYYAVLHGTGTPQKPREWCTTLAVSDDLLHWHKYSGNPLLPLALNRSSGQLVQTDNGFRLYTMHGAVMVHSHDGVR
ncbi:MAG: glycosylase [Planctomycetaceae bacterium]|nr:glycosylase [Planctomycetaceae bacterium]